MIVFGAAAQASLQKVSAAGGAATAATTLDQGESGHRMPFFLPDGRHFLYRANKAVQEAGRSTWHRSIRPNGNYC